ncbi:MAG TPA: VOC family protein [Rhizomicrobium sp.]|nr:VOC family protein [Rhizomicrobium sp.]
MSLGIVGIDHIQIAVPRALEQECLSFYRTVLALSEIEKPENLKARGGAWFQIDPTTQVHIGIDPDASSKSRRHICFLVSDLAAAKATVQARDIPIEEEGTAEGLTRFFIRDPAGNRIEIGQRA